MRYIKCRKPVLSLFAIALAGVGLSAPAHAVIFKLPVSTATLAIRDVDYDSIGQPGVTYLFEVDPAVLKVGYDAATHIIYETFIIFDRTELLQLPTEWQRVSLYLTPLSYPAGTEEYVIQETESPTHAVVAPTDFYLPRGMVGEQLVRIPSAYPTWLSPASLPTGYVGWVLTSWGFSDNILEIAGPQYGSRDQGPIVVVDVVPEPPAVIVLALGVCGLVGLVKSKRRSQLTLAMLVAVAVVTGLSTPANAVIFKLPVASTATLSFDAAGLGLDGVPGVDYFFELNPPTLKFGYDEHSGLYYESMVIFDRQQLQSLPAGEGPIGLQLTVTGFPTYASDYYFIQLMQKPVHGIAETADFSLPRSWTLEVLPPYSVLYPVSRYRSYGLETDMFRFDAWILGSWGVDGGPAEYAGLTNQMGLEGPYMLVDVVPEPSALLALGLFLGVGSCLCAARSRRLRLSGLLLAAALAILLSHNPAASDEDEWYLANSEPGSKADTPLASMPLLTQTVPPEGYKDTPYKIPAIGSYRRHGHIYKNEATGGMTF